LADVTALELPTFKGRPGWEFTDLSRLSLDAFAAPDGGDLSVARDDMFELDGATRLDQVDGAVSEGAAVEDGPVVLPLSVARERHPELVEPHLGRVVAADDVFTRWNADAWEGGALVWVPRGSTPRSSSPRSPPRPAPRCSGAC
jgi:Fe-S cluster assembly protein SufD